MPNNKREKIPEGTLCVVCSDFASGIHYSVASCNGCKTFFRRALVNKQTFTCQFSGDCVVGKSVRCVCRSCRLKKCFDMGMDPKAIQHDRDKIRYTKALKKKREEEKRLKEMVIKEDIGSPQSIASDTYINTSTPSSSTMINILENDHHSYDPEAQNDVKAVIEDLLRLESRVKSLRNSYRFESQVSATSCMYSSFLFFSCLLDDITYMAENTHENEGTIEPFECSVEKLREWFVRDLSLMLEWGKCLPIMERLLLNDKLALMKAFAPIFPLIQLAFYTRNEFECDIVIKLEPDCTPKPIPERLNYPDGSFIEKGNKPANTWEEMHTMLIDGCYKMMRQLKIKESTFVLYKMLLFHNPDADGLSSLGKKTIENERMRLLTQLFSYLSTERGKEAQTIFSNLLMMSATLSKTASFIKRVFDFNHIFNRTNDLIDQLIIVGL
nr:nuclear receptor NHR-40 [Caenorhabditis elegans]|eukprot:NP_741729.1 Nuclear hormone receptor family member nhr-40 [Caenorhabditis elegans]